MRKTVISFVLCAVLFALSLPAEAQQREKVFRIGVLRPDTPASFASRKEIFRDNLRKLGYVEGKNISIEYRYAEGKMDMLPPLAVELVRLKPDVIVTGGTAASQAVRQATSIIPIIIGGAGDIVGQGLVASLAKPGGNITGLTSLAPDLSGKRLELLKEIYFKASRVGVLLHPNPADWDQVRETEAAARQLGVRVQAIVVKDPKEFQDAYSVMGKQGVNAVIIIQGSFTFTHRAQLVELALKHRLPSMCEQAEWAHEGCLISYGSDQLYSYVRVAVFVDKILKGTKPADIPVEQPTKFELVINLKTAKHIGLTIPPNVLVRADRVIK